MNPQLPHPAYRPDIDGLRAVAVSSVVVFHVAPAYVPGGFSGVDVFFVISGYLISTILFGGLDRGTFSMIEFYARRARRIFPALIATLTATFLFGWLVLVDSEFTALGKHIAAGAFFVSNFVLRSEAGYFDTAAEQKPLLHLWSLGIEEQYYIVWPLILLAAFRTRKGITPGLLVALLLSSFALGVARAPGNPVSTFFLPPTRIWELLLGSLLAYLTVFPRTPLDAVGERGGE
jgi:peptidoglycan/LPS O-acetylase OafA/YrhL